MEIIIPKAPWLNPLGSEAKTQRRRGRSRGGRHQAVKVSACAAPGHQPETQPCTSPVKAVTKRSYANTATGVLRVALSNTPFRRGKQRTGGTGAVQHPSSFICVQYSSFAVQQYVTAQQYNPAEAWCTAQQPLQPGSAASCTSSSCSSVL